MYILCQKHGIVPDGLVQRKLNSFILKYPNLERYQKRKIDDGVPILREGEGLLNVERKWRGNPTGEISKLCTHNNCGDILYKQCYSL